MISNKNNRSNKVQIYESAGKRIAEVRMKKGYSRDRMAAQIGVSGKFMYEIEKGKKGFSADVLLLIADYLGVGCDYIMKGETVNPIYNTETVDIITKMDKRHKTKIAALSEFPEDTENKK